MKKLRTAVAVGAIIISTASHAQPAEKIYTMHPLNGLCGYFGTWQQLFTGHWPFECRL